MLERLTPQLPVLMGEARAATETPFQLWPLEASAAHFLNHRAFPLSLVRTGRPGLSTGWTDYRWVQNILSSGRAFLCLFDLSGQKSWVGFVLFFVSSFWVVCTRERSERFAWGIKTLCRFLPVSLWQLLIRCLQNYERTWCNGENHLYVGGRCKSPKSPLPK